MQTQTCRRHPRAGRFAATCSGCSQELYDIQAHNEAMADARMALAALDRPQTTIGAATATRQGSRSYLIVASRIADVFHVDVFRRPTYDETRIELPNPLPWNAWIPVEESVAHHEAEHQEQLVAAQTVYATPRIVLT